MQMQRYRITPMAAVLATTLAACAAVYRTPGAERTPVSELAILEYNGDIAGVNVQYVDGAHRGLGIFRRFELAPGSRSLTIQLNKPSWQAKPITLSFNAAAGVTYELLYEFRTATSRSGNWRVWIVERPSGRTVSAREQ
jgi:hypothetical protein